MKDNKFNFDGRDYYLRPLPIAEKKRVKRKTMFEKSYVTSELVVFCVGAAALWAAFVYNMIRWMS